MKRRIENARESISRPEANIITDSFESLSFEPEGDVVWLRIWMNC